MPFSDRQSHNSFSIYLVNPVVEGHIYRNKLVYLDTEFEKLWPTDILKVKACLLSLLLLWGSYEQEQKR